MKIGDRVRVVNHNSYALNEEGIVIGIQEKWFTVQMPRVILLFDDTDLEVLENE